VTPRLEALTPEQVFGKAPAAEWREPTFGDPAQAAVEVACGASPRLREGTLYAAVRVLGRPARQEIAPLNVALVLDRSSSMHGQPFETMRRAAETFVGQLRDGDRLSVVVFSDGVFEPVAPVVIGPESRVAAVAAIRALQYDGLTNLSGGLLAGLYDVWGLVDGWRVSHLLLLSDGQPNRGITDRNQLAALAASAAERGVGLSTVGFGPDHDELLMQALADAGGGSYHYVESAADIPAVFQREATDLLSVAARDTVVQVDRPPGFVVEDVIGQDYYLDDGRVLVRLGAMPHDEERYLVLRLRPGATAPPAMSIAVVGSDMARRARFGVACRPRLSSGSGEDRWVLELAGRAESSWGLTEAMAWADLGTEPFAVAQLARTRELLAELRAQLGPGALADEERELAEAQARYATAVAARAPPATNRGGLAGLLEYGVGAALSASAPVAFHPLVRASLDVSWYGRPAKFYSARIQRPSLGTTRDQNRKNKAARYEAYKKARTGKRR
jgi:Mg-chelatase subunit ChlD